jgi:molybdopterin synthase sulfur carrier subunit
MPITVRYFASLKELMGRDRDTVAASEVTTVGDVWSQVSAGSPLPANTLAAVNMEYVEADHAVRDDDEVAFFPPVTGG